MNTSIKRLYLSILSRSNNKVHVSQHLNLIEVITVAQISWRETYLLKPGYVDLIKANSFL